MKQGLQTAVALAGQGSRHARSGACMGVHWARLGATVSIRCGKNFVEAVLGRAQVSERRVMDKAGHAGIDQREREHEGGMPCHGMASFGQVGLAPVLGKWVRGCREVRGSSRGAEMLRLGLSPSPIFSMGNILHPAYKVFEEMPERKIFSNFANLFGGLQTYIKRSRMVVVGFNLEKI